MPSLFDIDHTYGGDLGVSLSGDLATVDGLTRSQQRLLRRLLTNPGDYLWEPNYGGGLRKFIGTTTNTAQIEAVILAQCGLEAAISNPVVTFQTLNNGLQAVINYTDNETNLPMVLSIPLGS